MPITDISQHTSIYLNDGSFLALALPFRLLAVLFLSSSSDSSSSSLRDDDDGVVIVGDATPSVAEAGVDCPLFPDGPAAN